MRIRLTRKFALRLDGVDVSTHRVGDAFDLPDQSARLLMLEGWAEPVEEFEPILTPLHQHEVHAD